MIDWRLSPDFESIKEREWFFPSFEIQEFLLPQINVGKPFIDEYDATEFSTEDCARLKGNIEYLIDSAIFARRTEVQFDAFEKGLVTLSCAEIRDCLLKLYDAADQALKSGGTLVFCGD
ncbi:hypothetical protein [Haloferula sp. BvORR071]|uniref:hypothetical protein n=1 Tax=Haloferula sp. BvORR071 TaxID=1396141 RepID=UPI000557B577|nr:hypothetical protein [Haloferula sp. BvORR071]